MTQETEILNQFQEEVKELAEVFTGTAIHNHISDKYKEYLFSVKEANVNSLVETFPLAIIHTYTRNDEGNLDASGIYGVHILDKRKFLSDIITHSALFNVDVICLCMDSYIKNMDREEKEEVLNEYTDGSLEDEFLHESPKVQEALMCTVISKTGENYTSYAPYRKTELEGKIVWEGEEAPQEMESGETSGVFAQAFNVAAKQNTEETSKRMAEFLEFFAEPLDKEAQEAMKIVIEDERLFKLASAMVRITLLRNASWLPLILDTEVIKNADEARMLSDESEEAKWLKQCKLMR